MGKENILEKLPFSENNYQLIKKKNLFVWPRSVLFSLVPYLKMLQCGGICYNVSVNL